MGKQITLIFFCMALTACATVFDKTNDNISFTSEPSNANIYLNGRLMGRTPTSFQVSRSVLSGGTPQIAVEKERFCSIPCSTQTPVFYTPLFRRRFEEYLQKVDSD